MSEFNAAGYEPYFHDAESLKDLEELRKSLEAGYGTSPSAQTGAGAIRLESLQATLKHITFREDSPTMWRMISKRKAFSTIEEYTRLDEPGDAQWYVEGGLPEEDDASLTRQFEKVKFVGSVGKVSHVASQINAQVSAVATQVRARTLGIIRRVDKTLYFGNESVNGLEFDGLKTKVIAGAQAENVIDLRGVRLTFEKINEGAQVIVDNYGVPSALMVSPRAKMGYQDQLAKDKRLVVGVGGDSAIQVNSDVWNSANGNGKVYTDVFLRSNDPGVMVKNSSGSVIKREGQPPTAATSTRAPSTPTIGTPTTPAEETSLLPAATYDYRITGVNNFGESTPVTSTGVVVSAGDKAILPITEGGGSDAATAFNVYRKLDSASVYQFLFTIKWDASAPQNIDDLDLDMPGTTTAFMWDMNPDQVFAFHQLLPMFRMPLAIIDDSVRWLQKLYGVLVVYNPNKVVVFKNVGDTAA